MAEWLARWTCDLMVQGSIPLLYHSLDLFAVLEFDSSAVLCSTNNQHFMFIGNVFSSLFHNVKPNSLVILGLNKL